MRLHIKHRTEYVYASSASQSVNQVCLLPRNTSTQQCLHAEISIIPEPPSIDRYADLYGNTIIQFSLDRIHQSCTIITDSLVETADLQMPLPVSVTVSDNHRQLITLHSADALLAEDCLLPSPFVALTSAVEPLLQELPIGKQGVLEYAASVMQHIYTTFEYDPGFSTLVTPISEVVQARKGVCQDFAHLAISLLRQQGIPTRYVSGYLETLPPPGTIKLQGADASHAWFAVFDANIGWFDFDPTNNKRPDAQYVTTAWGRDYGDVTPVKGVVYGGGSHTLTVEVDVNRADDEFAPMAQE